MMLLLPLVLSEVLANEPGTTVALEWIELQATEQVQVSGYELVVNGDYVSLPGLVIDSGTYLVVCRDTVRFEEHFGDSSGTWGDHPSEHYPRSQAGMSLPNSSGFVELRGTAGSDRFAYTGSAPDGVSYERVGDSTWQVTDPQVAFTPGFLNHGAPVPFDWSLADARIDITEGIRVTVKAWLENRGYEFSMTMVYLVDAASVPVDSTRVQGESGERIEVALQITAAPGLNHLDLLLTPDDRPADDTIPVDLFGAPLPMYISEIYAVPQGSEPEWVEVYVESHNPDPPVSLVLTDQRDTAVFAIDDVAWDGPWLILTADSLGFRYRYPEVTARVWQGAGWPALNNSGDTLVLLLSGAFVERVSYPSAGSRRGVAQERVGTSAVWAPSVATAGATPGARNSVDVPYRDQIAVEVTPNPFAPGSGETAHIHFEVPFAAEGEVRLYGGDGRHLRTLHEAGPLVSGQLTWDGKDTRGRLLPVGIYLLQFRLSKPHEQARLTAVVVAR